MSRSYKKQPYVQDNKLREYWRIVRRVNKQKVKKGDYDGIKKHNDIINDYNFRDYKMHVTNKKYLRK